jgi:hypothetical protein
LKVISPPVPAALPLKRFISSRNSGSLTVTVKEIHELSSTLR